MREQILISVSGLQVVDGEAIPTPELITTGTYTMEEEQLHRIVYEEQLDGSDEITVNELLFSDSKVELKKEGQVQSHLIFEEGKTNLTFYHTPFGTVSVALTADRVKIRRERQKMDIQLEYGIAMNEQHLGECSLNIHIWPQEETEKAFRKPSS